MEQLVFDIKKLDAEQPNLKMLVNNNIELFFNLDTTSAENGAINASFDPSEYTEDEIKKIIKEVTDAVKMVMNMVSIDLKKMSAFELAEKYGCGLANVGQVDYATSAKLYSLKKGSHSWYLD